MSSRFEAIFDSSPDALLLVDGEGRITYANARTRDLLGYDPAELHDEPVERLVPESVADEHVELRNAYLADPETRPMGAGMELAARCKDGTTIPVDVSLSPVESDERGEVLAAVRDARENRRLRKTYRTILESVPDAIVVVDATTGEIVETNERVVDLFGVELDSLVGEPQTVLHPADRRADYRELFGCHVEAGQATFSELPDGTPIQIETSDGERVPVEINANVFEVGDDRLITGSFRDRSARREYERRIETLHETTRRLMRADTREEIATTVSEATRSILGYSRNVVRLAASGGLEPVAVTGSARSDMGDRPAYPIDGDSPAAQAIRAGEPRLYDDIRTVEDDHDRGEARSVMYLPLGDHGVISIVETDAGAFDASDVDLASILAANAEAALSRLDDQRQLERQNDRLDDFASIVAHDLRNPLSVATGWLELARTDRDGDALDRVEEALDRMAALIEDLLALARYGSADRSLEPLHLAMVAEEAWKTTSTAEATLVVETDRRILADERGLRQLFENLFRNAVDHAEGAVTVTIGDLDRGFFVADDGPGISADDRERVFDHGYTTTGDGTGLGLSIVKRIAEDHGWHIALTESSTGGARIELRNVESDRQE